jgi:hypothetical protein
MIRRMGRKRIVDVMALTGLLMAIFLHAEDATAKDKPQPKRRPSTAAERTSAAKAARELETDPIGPGAEARRKAALVVLEAPDIQVKICANLLASFANEKSSRHGLLLQQVLFSTMAFMIEQPDSADNHQAGYLEGILGALKAYGKIRSREAGSRSAFFEKLLDLQGRGELGAYVWKESEPCAEGRGKKGS